MDISAEDFRSHFEVLSDKALLATKRDDLVAAAQAVYDQELVRRGLNEDGHGEIPEPEGDEAPVAAPPDAPAQERLVSVGSFTDMEEARMARGLLQSAGIPSGLENEKASMIALHLMVPESYEEAALQVLGGEISEEELAAQAEAAGFSDYGEFGEPEEEEGRAS
ncbi:MAG: DUF2007 domain-containing protein [Acidobacteriota bacterium]